MKSADEDVSVTAVVAPWRLAFATDPRLRRDAWAPAKSHEFRLPAAVAKTWLEPPVANFAGLTFRSRRRLLCSEHEGGMVPSPVCA